MDRITFYDGLTFNLHGIYRTCTERAQHYPTYYGLQYIHAGYLTLTIDHGACHTLRGPVAFITTPQHFYEYYSPKGTERQHYYVCFSGERAEHYRSGGLLHFDLARPYFPILAQQSFMQGMLALILSIQNNDNYEKSVLLLEQMLLSLHDQTNSHAPSGEHLAFLESLAEKIMLDPELPWDFKQQAQALNISEKHFILLFRNVHGVPPHHFVIRQRLNRATELLMKGHDSVKSIAYSCGFQSEFHFSRIFKKYFKISPSEYRKQK